MNLSINFLNINLINYSPFLSSTQKLNIKLFNSELKNSFSSLIFSETINLNFYNNIFQNFLRTTILLTTNSYNYLNISSNSFIPFNTKIELFKCLFWKCYSITNSAGIYTRISNHIIIIKECGFYQLTCSQSGYNGQASCISCLYNNLTFLTKICFYNCQCPHGASYLILFSNIQINETIEYDIGKNSRISDHPSSTSSLIFYFNNITDCSAYLVGYYFHSILQFTDNIKYSQTQRINGYHFQRYQDSNNFQLNLLNFINNTCSYWFYTYSIGNVELNNCYFYNNGNSNILIGSISIQFLNCYFSNLQNSLNFGSCSLTNCNFNYLILTKPLINLNNNLCLKIDFSTKLIKFKYNFLIHLLIKIFFFYL